MNLTLGNFGVLLGLAALAIPVILHLLQRRQMDTLDWAAMQFLPEIATTQQRRRLDELLLLALRMAIIAGIVLALASPSSTGSWLAGLDDSPSRDVVLVFDASYSMNLRLAGQTTPWEDAIRAARTLIEQAKPGDRFSMVLAKRGPELALSNFTSDHGEILAKLDALPPPHGNIDMPKALARAWQMLQTRGKSAIQEIIILSDGQQFGWADPATLAALDQLGAQWHDDAEQAKKDGRLAPSLRVISVGPELPKALPNFAIGPVTTSHRIARLGQKLTFRAAMHLEGFAHYVPPRRVQVFVDGKLAQTLALPERIDLKQGQIPLRFECRFDEVGPHKVAVKLDAEAADDVLPGDNAQEITVEIVKDLPILVIDGDARLSNESSSFFVQRALPGSTALPCSAVTVPEISKAAVVVLADVPRLRAEQAEAIERFLADGGGMLISVGPRVAEERAHFQEQLYRHGEGWLPANLLEIGAAKDGVRLDPNSFQHPALELFRSAGDSSLGQVGFSRWWRTKLQPNVRATVLAAFDNGDPLLIEKPYKKGRVILCTAPLDRRWDSTLPGLWEYPILLNELAYYLAGARMAPSVLPLDLRESKLDRCTADDWRKVRARLPVQWNDGTASRSIDEANRHELWWLLLLGVLLFLCVETWMTRRIALARGV